MDAKQILKDIQRDLASAPAARVIYLEGPSDEKMFFGLLGVVPAVTGSYVHKNTLVKGLGGIGKVKQYVDVAVANGVTGHVFGVADGDGAELVALTSKFDHPFSGPMFTWKAYCIESFFPQCVWNAAWGAVPNWQVDLLDYAPYVALSRVHLSLEEVQVALGLAKRRKPIQGQPLLLAAAVQADLAKDKHLITGFDAEASFVAEMTRFCTALTTSIQHGLALLNGKWLFDHFMTSRLGRDANHWISQWSNHLASAGGLQEVRDLWQRITGSPP
jgi:hypothetical protein